MATATKATRTVTRMVEVEDTEAFYTLTISADEARTLLRVCSRVGGDCTNSPRAHTDSIKSALLDAGAQEYGGVPCKATGSIYF